MPDTTKSPYATEYTDYFNSYVCNTGPHGMTWDEWAEIADLAGEIDFGCNFDCNGWCEGSRDRDYATRPKDEPHYTCCENCADSKGYLARLPVEAVETVVALFDKRAGFNGPNGCRLPGKWRSRTCLDYKCDKLYSTGNFNEAAWQAWGALVRHGINRDKNITVETVREKMREAGLLKIQQRAQLVALA